MMPTPTPDTVPYWDAAKEGRLVIQYCRACERHYFYPRDHCPDCGSADVEWREASGRGRLASYVINHRPMPPTEDGAPLVIALVELAEGVRLLSNIVGTPADPDALPLDAAVTVGFQQRGEWKLPVFHVDGAA